MSRTVFTRYDPDLGKFALRELRPDADGPLLHAWVTHRKARFWQMQHVDLAEVVRQYRAIKDSEWHDAFLGLHDGRPAFLAERYYPANDPVSGAYDPEPGDVGMHFLVAPADRHLSGFTRAVITTVMEWLFSDPSVRRVVVEPDVRNTAVHALNAAVGFRVAGPVRLPDKEALLSLCTREQFQAAQHTHAFVRDDPR